MSKQYKIYDVSVANQNNSYWYKKELLDKPLDRETWLGLLFKEIEAYCDSSNISDISSHWKLTMYQMFKGQPVEINGMEFVKEE